ncbi:MAG TPA: phosphopantetheine-binding protein [Acidimicrobiia bacterium]
MTASELRSRAAERRELCAQIKEMLVERLDLPIDADWITDDQPLFGRGLELDSVDALELAVGIDDVADVTITDDQVGMFGSVNRVVDFVETHRNGPFSASSTLL